MFWNCNPANIKLGKGLLLTFSGISGILISDMPDFLVLTDFLFSVGFGLFSD